VLGDDTYWLWYSAVGQPSVLAGGFQGSGLSQNGTFTSSNGKDFSLVNPGQLDAALAANYVIRQSFDGVITYPTAAQTSFTSTFKTDYDAAPNLASLVGTYMDSPNSMVTIDPSGSIFGQPFSVCAYAGTVSPRTSGNVYDVSVTAIGRLCGQSGTLLTGVASFDAATKRLYIMTIDSVNRTFAFLFLGTKQ
jgi:hypothetical protein